VAVLAVSLAAVTSSLVTARRERDAARAAQQTADATGAFLANMLASVNPANRGPGSTVDVRMRDVLDDAVKRLDAGAVGNVEVAAQLRYSLGRSYLALSNYAVACRQFTLASRAMQQIALTDARTVKYTSDAVNCLLQDGHVADAEAALRPVFQACDRAPGPPCATAYSTFGNLEFEQGRYAASAAAFRRALALDPLPADNVTRLNREYGLARALARDLKYQEAVTLYRSVLARQERARGKNYLMSEFTRNGLAIALQGLKRYPEAIETFQQNLANITRLLGPESDLTIRTRYDLSQAYCDSGQFVKCRDMAATALELQRAHAGLDNPQTVQYTVGYGKALFEAGDRALGLETMAKGVAAARRVLPPGHPHLTADLVVYAERLARTGRWQEARSVALDAYDQAGADGPTAPLRRRAASVLAQACDRAGNAAKAAVWRARAAPG